VSKENTAIDAAETFKDRATTKQKVQTTLHNYPWLSSAAVLIAAVFVFNFGNENFLTTNNLSLILQQTAVIGAIAAGQTLIILTAGIDLSCGAIAIFASMVMAKTAFVNGWLITKVDLPPFIVTLGTFNVFSALTLFYATGRTIMDKELSPMFLYLGEPITLFSNFRITYGVLLVIFMYIILAFALRYTAWGRHVYAVGDDIEAARLAGIQVKRVLMSVYVSAGFIFAITSWIIIGRVGAASPNSGSNLNLDSITAVVIGGTSLFGGRGAIFGSLIGAVIVGVFRNGLTLAGVDLYYQTFAVGLLIITAVSIDQWIRKARV